MMEEQEKLDSKNEKADALEKKAELKKVEDTELLSQEILDLLDSYTKNSSSALLLECYRHILKLRKNDTFEFLQKREQAKKSKEDQTSKFVKVGRVLRKIVIFGIVFGIIGFLAYGIYFSHEMEQDQNNPFAKMAKKSKMSSEDIAKMAQERERAEQRK